MIDAHHHLWDLSAIEYPWLNAQGVKRFFGDPTPIQKNYLIGEFCMDASAHGFDRSVHIQVGAHDGLAEARWVQSICDANPNWPMAQVVFCDLTSPNINEILIEYLKLSSVRGVRQIIGRSPEEDGQTGTNAILKSDALLSGLQLIGEKGLSFDLQLIPELMSATTEILQDAPNTQVALCHAGSPHDRSVTGLSRYANQLRGISALSHVTCKLSGLGMFDLFWTTEKIKPIVDVCLDQFGEDRCMFGSNFPVDSLYSDYARLVHSYQNIIPNKWHSSVFSEVANRFYFQKKVS